MIVPTMSNLEIYNEMVADLPKLKIRANTLMSKVVKEFRKKNHFPAWQCHEYTHQGSKNKYLISFYTASAKGAERPIVDYIGINSDKGGLVAMKSDTWLYRKDERSNYISIRVLNYYSGHFFSRYRERIWPNVIMSTNELICRYFTRNKHVLPIKLNEDIKRHYKEYGELSQYGMRVADGICFTSQGLEGDESTLGGKDCNYIAVNWYHTIVSQSLLSDEQKEAITKEGNDFIKSHFYEPFKSAFERVVKNLPPHLWQRLKINSNKIIP